MTSVELPSESTIEPDEPGVEFLLGRISPSGVERGFIKDPSGPERSLAEILEAAIELPLEDSEGLVLWVREIPDIPEDLKQPDIFLADGRVVIDQRGKELRLDGVPQQMHLKPFEVLRLLANKKGKVFREDEILRKVWGPGHKNSALVKSSILSIRRALGDESWMLHTKRHVGYKLDDRRRPEPPA